MSFGSSIFPVKRREAIWCIQIAKYRRDPKDCDTVQLARATEGLTGSEIENVFVAGSGHVLA